VSAVPGNAVVEWFGPQFPRLDPLLQQLHRRGGLLTGEVRIDRGHGLADWIGGRLLRRLGLPPQLERSGFGVQISHGGGVLHWNRRFGHGNRLCSQFRPVGSWPGGYWIERIGRLELRLTVDVVEGGWYWRCLGVRLAGVPLPLWLFPRTTAYKRVEQGRYRFGVRFELPLLGTVLGYSGLLEAHFAPLNGGQP
jgi:hypothetical protein